MFKISSYLIESYLKRLTLKLLVKQSDNQYKCSCPICGDGIKKSYSKRMYISLKGTYYCHNCGCTGSFINLVKLLDYSLYIELIQELKKENIGTFIKKNQSNISAVVTVSKPKNTIKNNVFEQLIPLDIKNNSIYEYIKSRKIPSKYHNEVYYFKGNPFVYFNKSFKIDKYKNNSNILYEGVLVPFKNKDDEYVGFSLRVTNNSNMRFINLFVNENNNNFLFGENLCDFNKPVYILEGMFDKLSFESNQVLAMLSTNIKLDYVREKCKNDVVYIFDREYFNSNLRKNILKVLDSGYKVFLFDNKFPNCKDMNDIFKNYDISEQAVFDYINNNSFSGDIGKIMLLKRFNQFKELYNNRS